MTFRMIANSFARLDLNFVNGIYYIFSGVKFSKLPFGRLSRHSLGWCLSGHTRVTDNILDYVRVMYYPVCRRYTWFVGLVICISWVPTVQESEKYYVRLSQRSRAIRDINIIHPSSLRATPIKTLLLVATIYPFVLFFHFFHRFLLPCLSSTIILASQSGSTVIMLSDRRCMNILTEIQIVQTEIYYYNKIIRAPATTSFRNGIFFFLFEISRPSGLHRNVDAKEQKLWINITITDAMPTRFNSAPKTACYINNICHFCDANFIHFIPVSRYISGRSTFDVIYVNARSILSRMHV